MDLTPTDEQAALIEELHRVGERQIRPAARACEAAGEVSPAIRSALADLGVTGVAEEYGGQGEIDTITGVLVAEELAWGDPGVAYDLLAQTAAAWLIGRAGTPGQRARLLPQVGSGCAVALAERDGADLFALSTGVEEIGSRVALTGVKYAVAGFGAASTVLVAAGGQPPAGRGPSVWAVPAAALPVAAATREDKLGLRSAATWRLRLDGVEVDRSAQLGEAGAAAVRALLAVKLLTASINVGLARAAVEYASGYARERTAFGRPIGAFQGVSFMIAERAIGVDAARLLVWEAAAALDAGAGTDAAARGVMAACGQAVTAAAGASDDAVQVLGGHGYMRDHPVELWYRDAMTLATLDAPWLVSDAFLGAAPSGHLGTRGPDGRSG